MKNIIFHIDVNSAFLSWEAVYRITHKGRSLDLRAIPSAVEGDMALWHGIILAKSLPAKKYGIKTGEIILEAQRKCPNLVLVPPNYGLSEKCSAAFMDILREYSDTVVEQYSIDEAFVDMTASCHLIGQPEEVAGQIKDQIRERLGFTVNVGVSSNKLLAKMASDFKKPDMVHTLYPEEIQEKMWPLPVSDLFFVGRTTAQKLFSVGIKFIGELVLADPVWLRSILKKQGEVIWGFANGIDLSPVLDQPPANKGYGNSTTTPYDVTDVETADKVLLALAETVGNRLREDNAQIEVVSVSIRYAELSYVSHQKILQTSTNLTWEIYQAACELFLELWNYGPIKGKQREIGCYCWFTNKGKMIPTMLKVQARTVRSGQYAKLRYIPKKEKCMPGPSIEFNCTITILEQQINVWMIFYKEENRWGLVYRHE